mgnify:CR=1 FL=1
MEKRGQFFLDKETLSSLKFTDNKKKFASGWFTKPKLIKESLPVVYTVKKTMSMENFQGQFVDHLSE